MNEKNSSREQKEGSNVLERLRVIVASEAKEALDAEASVDAKAGIVIAPLESVDPVMAEDGQEYRFYAARVLPPNEDNPNFVNPHQHFKGVEPYRFLAGTKGEMNSGFVQDDEVVWNDPREVNPDDEIVIQEGQVHSFRNNGVEPTDFVFACPDNHLVDHTDDTPEGDRYFTTELKNSIPPWYPQKKL